MAQSASDDGGDGPQCRGGVHQQQASTSGSFRFATAAEIEVRLARRYPHIEKDVLGDFAYAVSINKYSYNDAKKMLAELTTFSTVEQAVVEAIEQENDKERRKQQERERRFQEELEAEQRKYDAAARIRRESSIVVGGGSRAVVTDTATSEQNHGPVAADSTNAGGRKTSMLVSSASDGAHQQSSALGATELILYVTSMTGSRQVRAHCRLLNQLLYIKRLLFTELDIADNAFLQRHLQCLIANSHSGASAASHATAGGALPLLFVGEHFIGNYEHCQRLEDEGLLIPALQSYGFVYVPQPIQSPATAAVSGGGGAADDFSDDGAF